MSVTLTDPRQSRAAERSDGAPLPSRLRIGPLEVDPPVVLAPMAGVTNSAFRSLCRSYGAGLYVSEMVSARAMVAGNTKTARMLLFGPDEPVRSIQLYGVDPVTVGAAVSTLVGEVGADHVDLNMGCPVPKVTKLGGGAAIPAHPRLLAAIVRAAVASAGAVPVTVKMRIGLDARTSTWLDAARAAADAGAAAVALHARTAEQLYSGSADWSVIGRLVEALPDVPVLGNGDIWAASDGVAMMRETGCAGVVVGRGCLGKPWLFRDLADAFAGRPVAPAPRLGTVLDVMRRHVRLLVEVKGDELVAVRDFRKHVGWYLTGYPVGGEVRRTMAQTSSLVELDEHMAALDPELALPVGSERLHRGHSQGPRPVSLPVGWRERADDEQVPLDADVLVSGG